MTENSSPLDDKDDVRERVLRASVTLIEEEGLASLSMREVARRAGVSHQAPYYYFSDREAILAAIAERGFRLLDGRIGQARTRAQSATEAIELAGVAYVTFACEHPAHFRIMFRPELVNTSSHQSVECRADAAFRHVPEMVVELFKAGFPADVSIDAMSVLLWSLVHGCACLLLDGPILEKVAAFGQNRDRAVSEMAHTLRRMVQATIEQHRNANQ